jgi:ParB/RepB/Spo0J family partition protein
MALKLVAVDLIKARQSPDAPQLADSLGLIGQRDPINVRPMENGQYKYEIASGNRRFWSMVGQGVTEVWVVILPSDDVTFYVDTLTLNSGTPNFMDEADSIRHLIEDEGMTKEEIAQTTSLSLSTVQSRVDLYEKLIPEFQRYMRVGQLKYSGTIDLVKLPKHRQLSFFQRMQREIDEGKRSMVSVRECQQEYRAYKEERIQGMFDIETPSAAVLVGLEEEGVSIPHDAVENQSQSALEALYETLVNHQWAARTSKGDREFMAEFEEEFGRLLDDLRKG